MSDAAAVLYMIPGLVKGTAVFMPPEPAEDQVAIEGRFQPGENCVRGRLVAAERLVMAEQDSVLGWAGAARSQHPVGLVSGQGEIVVCRVERQNLPKVIFQ